MDSDNGVLVPAFVAYTIGIVVYFIGMNLNRRIRVLRAYNIPEPVTGGLLAALAVFGLYAVFGVEVSFDLATRDRLLVYFFTAIGLNARLSDLIAGGRPLGILLGLTVLFIVLQNVVGIGAATLLDLPAPIGILVGSASLIGGHGTAIAWAPAIAAEHGVPNAMEIGIAAATLGLVLASLIGGPIAKYLLSRHALSGPPEDGPVVGISHQREATEQINHVSIMSVLLTLHVSIILGYLANQAIESAGLKLPLFVSCLLAAIVLSNVGPVLMPRVHWPMRTRALAIVSDFSLGLFLAMSLMSMQLWTIAGLAGPLLAILALQALAAAAFILMILFPLMGRDYQAAVLSAGFGGFALGATPTAIANMTAVTKTHGPAPTAFIILPLVSAFFVDITNAFVIQTALAW
ncbi:MAG: sodium/glutamate symporter [Inquilinus sp.]|nr:sodium/glutamate symporter [Inquilinus sp.]